jgi:aminoglycoside 6-adenylyltransferase
VRAMIWNSSLAKRYADPKAELHDIIDEFSDYDIALVVENIHPYFNNREWLSRFGTVLVLYRDPIELVYGGEKSCFVTQYEDGLKIDFILWTVDVLRGILKSDSLPEVLDVGYAVLLDKDGLAAGLKPPSYRAFIPQKPSEGEYLTQVELFFHESTYAAKYLWRDELLPAKDIMDGDMKSNHLRLMFEWLIETDHDWTLKPGGNGRYLKQRLPTEIWSEFEMTYVGPGLDENWTALFRLLALYQKTAVQVGDRLGYAYPFELDKRMHNYLNRVRLLSFQKKELAPDVRQGI